MSETIEAKLVGLGVPADRIQDDVEILSVVSTLEGLTPQFQKRHYTCSEDQYLNPMFKNLYERDAAIRERVHKELGNLGVPSDMVDAFFIEYSQAGITFHLSHEEIPIETREKFIQEANQLSLTLLKKYLGF